MDTPRKNNDCYFYYYSTCLKGDGCTFRHEPAALGSETVCSFWAQGKCINQPCNFRHMELKKNRKNIPCYWETQPGGCQKSHCSFQHKNPREGAPRETNQSNNCDAIGEVKPENASYPQRRSAPGDVAESSEADGSRRLNQDFNSTPVDPLVVNFEEESDNESVPASSPVKRVRVNRAKTQEELHLERIQEESAAYYNYNVDVLPPVKEPSRSSAGDFRILTLAEIRAQNTGKLSSGDTIVSTDNSASQEKVQKAGVGFKRRAHSPIKFDISQAEPSVHSKRAAVKSKPVSKASVEQSNDEVRKTELDSHPERPVGRGVKLKRSPEAIPSRPIRLKRARVEIQPTNGACNPTKEIKSMNKSGWELGNNEILQEKNITCEIVSKSNELLASDSQHSVESESNFDRSGEVSDSIDTSCADVCKPRWKGRDESVDEDLLLDSTMIHEDDDDLPDDIDAFLDD